MAEVFNIGDEVIIRMPFSSYTDKVGIIFDRNEWQDEDEEWDEEEDEYITTPRDVIEFHIRFIEPIQRSGYIQETAWFEDYQLAYHNTLAKITEPSEDIYNDLI